MASLLVLQCIDTPLARSVKKAIGKTRSVSVTFNSSSICSKMCCTMAARRLKRAAQSRKSRIRDSKGAAIRWGLFDVGRQMICLGFSRSVARDSSALTRVVSCASKWKSDRSRRYSSEAPALSTSYRGPVFLGTLNGVTALAHRWGPVFGRPVASRCSN